MEKTEGIFTLYVPSRKSGERNIRASTADLTPGVSALNNGEIYLVYE